MNTHDGGATVTDMDVVLALKAIGKSCLVGDIARHLNATTRAVASAARKPRRDGRITVRHLRTGASYRFVRLTAIRRATGVMG